MDHTCVSCYSKNYIVYGLLRKSATGNTKNIQSLIENKKYFNKKFFIIRGDMLDIHSIESAINYSNPHEIYNFADQDNVTWSTDIPAYSMSVTAFSVINILKSLKIGKRK